jgi:hypothetical protein
VDILKNIISLVKQIRQGRTCEKRFLPPESLPPEAMAEVMREVEFLRHKHAVDVQGLLPDETPTTPKQAGG